MNNVAFHSFLLRYFRNGCIAKSDKLFSLFFSQIPFFINAKKIKEGYIKNKNSEATANRMSIIIENYDGSNPLVHKIKEFISPLESCMIGAYVHGSMGTYEEISYSDFDGFVILKDSVFYDTETIKKVGIRLYQSEKIMREIDPLQHHGWFILTESDLRNYPEHYFPHELFKYSKSLFGESNISFQLNDNDLSEVFKKSFDKLANSILKKTGSKSYLTNQYSFKNLLSEFMLLPSIYIQAKTQKGIFKKFSFDILRQELGSSYEIMDKISKVRANWNYKPSLFYRLLSQKRIPILSGLCYKSASGKLPADVLSHFNEELGVEMSDFVLLLQSKIKN